MSSLLTRLCTLVQQQGRSSSTPWTIFRTLCGICLILSVTIAAVLAASPAWAQGTLNGPRVYYEDDGSVILSYNVKSGIYENTSKTYTIETAGTATAGSDYIVGTLETFPTQDNELNEIINYLRLSIEFKTDSIDESDETIELKFYCDCGQNSEKILADSFTLTLRNATRPKAKFTKSSISINEGSTGTYGLSLDADPGAGKTVEITVRQKFVTNTHPIYGPIEVGATSSTLGASATYSFTGGDAGNWATPQTVMVKIGTDWENKNYKFDLRHAIDGTLDKFTKNVRVTVKDVTGGLIVSKTALTLKEGETGTFEVKVIEDPGLNTRMKIEIAVPDAQKDTLGVRVGTESSFTQTASANIIGGTEDGSNWQTAAVFTVKALKDTDLEDAEVTLTPALTVPASFRNPRIFGFFDPGDRRTGPDVTVTATETLTELPLTFKAPATLKLEEGVEAKNSASFNVGFDWTSLLTPITVTIDVPAGYQNKVTVQEGQSGQPGASVDITFPVPTGSEREGRKNNKITVTALKDPDTANESFDLTYTVPAPAGYKWNDEDPIVTSVAVTDIGSGVIASDLEYDPADGFAEFDQLSEGFSATYTIGLKSHPGGTVKVNPTSSSLTAVKLSPASLSFTSSNWSEPQTVTVKALEDNNAIHEKITISHAVSGYGDLVTGPEIKVNIRDDELPVTAGLTLRMTGNGIFKEPEVGDRGDYGYVEVELMAPSGYTNRLPRTPFRLCYTLLNLQERQINQDDPIEGTPENCIDLYTLESGGQSSEVGNFSIFEIVADAQDLPADDTQAVTVTLKENPNEAPHSRVSISTTENEFTFDVIDSNPTQITMSADDGAPTTIGEGSGKVDFDVELSRVLGAGEEVRIPLTASGTGITDEDYIVTFVSGTGATLSAKAPYTLTLKGEGAQNAKLKLTAVEDLKDDGGTEALTLTLDDATSNLDLKDQKTFGTKGTSLGSDKSFSVDILDGITVSVSAGDAVDEGGDAVFTVTATPAPTRDLEVELGVTQTGAFVADAELGTDKTLTILATKESAEYTVPTLNDEVDELDGAVTVTLIDSEDYRIETDAGEDSVTVTDNDNTTVTLTAANNSVTEGSPVSVTATLSLAQDKDIEIPISASVEQGDSAEDVDFSAPANIVIKSESATGSVDVATIKDADKDDDTFTVGLGATLPSGITAGTPSKVGISITDDGKGAKVSLSAAASTVKDTNDASITATLSHVFVSDITVPISVAASGTNPAESGEWDAPSGILIPKGSATASAAIDIIRDQDRDDETFTVSLGSPLPTNLTAGTTTSIEITIEDDGLGHDITLSASPNPVDEGVSTTITASANGRFDADTAIPLTVKGHGTNKAEDSDYEAPAEVAIAKGATSGTVTLSTNEDKDEDNDVVRVSLGTPLPAGVTGGNTHDITIMDTGIADGPTLTLKIVPKQSSGRAIKVDEGKSVTFTATLDKAWSKDITLEFDISLSTVGNVASEDDYSELSNITIAAGKTSASTKVTAVADGEFESGGDEEFIVTVRNTKLPELITYESESYTFNPNFGPYDESFYVQIIDQDKPIPTISIERRSFSALAALVTEGDDAEFTLKRSGGTFPQGGIEAKLKVEVDGAAKLPAGKLGEQTFKMTSSTGSHYTLTTTNDTDDQPDGAITVTLVEDSAYKIDAAKNSATINVIDDDPTVVTIEGSSTAINENGGTNSLTLTLSRELVEGEELPVRLNDALLSGDTGSAAAFPTDFFLTLNKGFKGVEYSTEKFNFSRDLTPVITFKGGDKTHRVALLELTTVDDKRKEGDELARLTLDGLDDRTGGLGGGAKAHKMDNSVSFTITDNDTTDAKNVTVAPTSLTLNEDEEGEYYIVIDKGVEVTRENFRDNYTVTLSSTDDAVTFAPNTLNFSYGRFWDKPQKVTVTAVNDNKVNDSPRTATIEHTVANYPGVTTAANVTITVNDDTSGLKANPETWSFAVNEVGHRINLELTTKPKFPVTIGIKSSNSAVMTLSKTSMNFTPENWYIPQAVNISGVKEGKANITFSVSSTADRRYRDKQLVVPVTVTPDTRPKVNLSASANSAAEGEALTLKATLSAAIEPSAPVTIPLTYTNGTAENADYTKVASITIAAGATEGTANFTPADNNIYEGDETVTIAFGTLPSTVVSGTTTEQAITITDEADLPTLRFLDSAQTVGEDEGTLDLALVWGGESELDSSVDWTTADGTATAGSDYTATSGTITRKAGSTSVSAQIRLAITDDTVDDPGAPETITVTLSNAAGAKPGSKPVHTVSITDNEPTEVRLIADKLDLAEAEGKKTIQIEVVRDLAAPESVKVPLDFSGAASFGVDYILSAPNPKPKGVAYSNLASTDLANNPPTLTFTAGTGRKRIAPLIITAVQDTADEDAKEDLTVEIGTLSESGFGGGIRVRANEDSQTFAIVDDDDLPTLSSSAVSVAEGQPGETPTLSFTVSLTPASGREVTVSYADAASGTATSGTDYTAITGGTLTFAAGETSKKVDVALTGDSDDELDETVILRLISPVNAVFTGNAAAVDVTGTITDDDATGVILSTDGSTALAEGDATTSVSLTLRLSRDLKPGEIAEIPLNITSATGVAIKAGNAANRDYILTASGTGVTVTDTTKAKPKIKLTGASGTEQVATIKITATARDDGDAQHERFTVALGNLADSALATTLSGGLEATTDSDPLTDDNEVEITITDDEGLKPLLNLAAADGKSAPAEGSPAEYKLTLLPTAVAPLAVKITVAEEGGLDYIAATEEGGRTLTVPANQSVFNFTVLTAGNSRDEESGAVTVTLVADSAYRIGTSGAHTIAVLDDEPTELTIRRIDDTTPNPIHEDGGTAELEFTLAKALGADNTVTIPLTVQGATLPAHATLAVKPGQTGVRLLTANPYSAAQPALELSGAGVTKGVLVLTAVPNSDQVERTLSLGSSSSTINVAGAGFDGGIAFAGSAVGVAIANDDGTPEVRIEGKSSRVNEGDDFKLYLHVRPVPEDTLYIRVEFSQLYDSIYSVYGGGDSGSSAGTYYFKFPARQTAPETVTVTTIEDNSNRPNGWIDAVVAANQGYRIAAAPDNKARTGVIDDDDGPTLSIAAGSSVSEGGVAVFTVTRDMLAGNPAFPPPNVNIRISQEGDVAAADGLGVKKPKFTGNERTLTVRVNTVDDSNDEANARIIAELLDCPRAQYGGGSVSTCAVPSPPDNKVSVSVQDDDPDVAMVNVWPRSLSLSERKRETGTYKVSLQTDPGQSVTVRVDVPAAHTSALSVKAPGSAPGTSATLGFTGGASGNWNTAQTVTVAALQDDDTDSERVTLTHTVTGYTGVTSAPDFSVTVTDAEYSVLTDKTRVEVREFGGTATYRVRLSSAPTAPVTVTPVSSDVKLATVSGPLTFNSSNWKNFQDVTVTGVRRSGGTPVRVTHQVVSTDSNYSNLSGRKVSVVSVSMLRDQRPEVTLSATPNPVREGSSVTVTATLNGIIDPAKAIVIPLIYKDAGTTGSSDYTRVDSIAIGAGNKSGSVTITTAEDSVYEPSEGFTVKVDVDQLPEELNPNSRSNLTIKIDDSQDKPRVATLSVSPKKVQECSKLIGESACTNIRNSTDHETNGEVTVTVTLDKALNSPARAITIPLAYILTDAEEDDFTQLPSITINAGETQGMGKITINNDRLWEPDESFAVTLGADLPPEVTAGAKRTVNVTIIQDKSDNKPGISFSFENSYTLGSIVHPGVGRRNVDVNEDIGMMPVKVVRRGPTEENITVELRAFERGENVESSFKYVLHKDRIKPSESSVTFEVAVADNQTDDVDLFSQSFRLHLRSRSTGADVWGDELVNVNIIDDEPTLVTLTGTSDLNLTENDTADTAAIKVSLSRNLVENEIFEIPLLLTTSTGAALPGSGSPAFKLLPIYGLDSPRIGCNSYLTSLVHASSARPRIRISRSVSGATHTPCAVLHFAATNNDDGDRSNEKIKISLGDFSDKTLATTAGGGAAASATDNAVDLIIYDDEEAPDGFSLEVDMSTVAEDVTTAPTITVTAESNTGKAYTAEHVIAVSVGASGDTAKAPADYGTVTDFTITVPANQKSATASFVLTPVDDSVDEPDEFLSVTGKTTGLHVEPATITITDNDPTPDLSFKISPAAINESGSGNMSTVSAGISAASGEDITLVVTTVPVSRHAKTADLTYSANSTLTIPAGATASTGLVTLTAVDNKVDEANKEFTVFARVKNGHGVVAPSPLTLTVTDDDARGVTVAPKKLTVDEADDTGTAAVKENQGEYTVVLDSQPTGDVTVEIASGSTDLTIAPQTLAFTPANWNSPQKVTVTAVDDADINTDPNRIVTVSHTLKAGGTDYSGVSVDPVSVTIRDDEGIVEVSLARIDSGNLSEGGSDTVAEFTVTLNRTLLTGEEITVPLFVSGQGVRTEDVNIRKKAGASLNSHVSLDGGISTTLRVENIWFQAGARTATLEMVVADDNIQEGDETLTLKLGTLDDTSDTVDGVLHPTQNQFSVVIVDNDMHGVAYSLEIDPDVVKPRGFSGAKKITLTLNPQQASFLGVNSGDKTSPGDGDGKKEVKLHENGQLTAPGKGLIELVGAPQGLSIADVRLLTRKKGVHGMPASLFHRSAEIDLSYTGNTFTADASVKIKVGRLLLRYRGLKDGTPKLVPWSDLNALATTGHLTSSFTIKADGVTVQPATVSLTEGGAAKTYSLSLKSDPEADVTVTVTSSDPAVAVDTNSSADGDQSTLTITSGSSGTWKTPHVITLRGVEDGDTDSEASVTVSHSAAVASDTNNPYHGIAIGDVTVGVTDSGSGVILLDTSSLSVRENDGEASFKVRLKSRPAASIVITPSIVGSTNAEVSGPLTIAPADWNKAQTVTVVGKTAGSATVSLAITTGDGNGGDYPTSTSIPSVPVTVTADTRPQVELSISDADGRLIEGGSTDVTASLTGGTLGSALVVPVAISGGQAADYTFAGTITIAAGAASNKASISIVDDTIDEPTEILTLALGTLPAQVRAGPTNSVELAIIDGDATSVFMARAPPDNGISFPGNII